MDKQRKTLKDNVNKILDITTNKTYRDAANYRLRNINKYKLAELKQKNKELEDIITSIRNRKQKIFVVPEFTEISKEIKEVEQPKIYLTERDIKKLVAPKLVKEKEKKKNIQIAFDEEKQPEKRKLNNDLKEIQQKLSENIKLKPNKFYETSTTKRKTFFIHRFVNKKNMSVIDWLIAIKYFQKLNSTKELYAGITYFFSYSSFPISVKDEEDENQYSDYKSFSNIMVKELVEAETYGDLNKFIGKYFRDENSFGSDAVGENFNLKITEFLINEYKPKAGITYINANDKKNLKSGKFGRYIHYSSKKNNGDCIIECFRKISMKKNIVSKTVRKDLNIPSGFIELSKIPLLENYFNIKVSVITGDDIFGKPVYAYPTKEILNQRFREYCKKENREVIDIDYLTSENEILEEENFSSRVQKVLTEEEKKNEIIYLHDDNKYKDGHFAIITQKLKLESDFTDKQLESFRAMKRSKNKDGSNKKKRFFFFDYETVVKNSSYLIPYSCAVVVYEEPEFNYITETFEAPKKIDERFFVGLNSSNKFFEYLEEKNDYNFINVLSAYNGARFDNFLLLESIAKAGLMNKTGVFIANGAILKMKFLSYEVMDLCKFLCQPLQTALQGFKCEINKLSFSHVEVQRQYNNGKLKDWLIENMDKLYDYNIVDCLGLAELFFKVRSAVYQIGKKISPPCFSPSLSLPKSVKEKEEEIKKIKTHLLRFEKLDKNISKLNESQKKEYSLLQQIKISVKKFYKIFYVEDFFTISSLSFKLWRKTCSSKEVYGLQNRNIADFVKKAFIGGRSQIFRQEIINDKINSLDVKSLYPFVMENCDYPLGKEILTNEFKEDKLGIYYCKISNQPETKIIPLRWEKSEYWINYFNELESKRKLTKEEKILKDEKIKHQPLNWDYKEEITTVLSSVDIITLKEFGAKVEFLPFPFLLCENSQREEEKYIGVYWDESSKKVFEGYTKPLREGKTEQDNLNKLKDKNYNPALREFIKLCLNSLSGKVGQKEYNNETVFCCDVNDIQNFYNNHKDIVFEPVMNLSAVVLKGEKNNYQYKTKSAKPWQLSVFIYAYARRHMYLSVLSKCNTKFATDTDSCHMTEQDISKLKDEGNFSGPEKFGKFHIGSEFGDFEKEIDFETETAYYVAPKCYGLFSSSPLNLAETQRKEKMRFKGISKRDKLLIIDENFIDFCIKEIKKDESSGFLDFEKIKNTYLTISRLKQIKLGQTLFALLDIDKKFEFYETLPPALTEELYKRIMNNEIINIISSRIEKKIGGQSTANMKQIYLIKSASKKGMLY